MAKTLITSFGWAEYRDKLAAISQEAALKMKEYVAEHGFDASEEFVQYAYSVTSKYGEGAAELACQLRDNMIEYWRKGGVYQKLRPSEPAEPPTYKEVSKTVRGTTENEMPAAVGRLVKRTAEDTTLKNAKRDGAEVAFVPFGGEVCAFCITLASRGWMEASAAMTGDHAAHVHSNCKCSWCVRYSSRGGVEGYNPNAYKKMYDDAPGRGTEKIKSLRRQLIENNK